MYISLTKYKVYNQKSKHNKMYCTVLYNILHNYMFRPFFRPFSGRICLALTVMYPAHKVYYFDDDNLKMT